MSVGYLGLDLGGTLLKAVIATSLPHQKLQSKLAFQLASPPLHLYFLHFPSNLDGIRTLAALLESEGISIEAIAATGGGAHRYQQQLLAVFKKIVFVNEFDSLIKGYNMIQTNKRSSLYSVGGSLERSELFPFLLVNIGSGVSYLLVDKEFKEVKRLGGTCLGGGFFMGLAHLVNGPCSFEQLLLSAVEGRNDDVDLMVTDVYNQEEVPKELSGADLLVSMGKLSTSKGASQQDINKSLLYMVSFNLAQHAYLQQKLHKLRNVVFTGFFLRDNDITNKCIEKAYRFFSSKECESNTACYFVEHDGYIGSLGCILAVLPQP